MQLMMHPATRAFPFSILFTAALSSVVQVHRPLSLEGTTLNRTLPSNGTLRAFSLGETRIRCNGDIYGRGLTEESCTDALLQIEEIRNIETFGPRGGPEGHFQVDLPHRWISGMHLMMRERSNRN